MLSPDICTVEITAMIFSDTLDFRLALTAVEQTHNTTLYCELRQRLQQATGDNSYSPDNESAVTFVSITNRKAAIMV